MREFDVLIVGSGSGMNIASRAVEMNLEVALVDKDPLGGTCLNRGCIPSKTMVYPADVISEADEAEKLGVKFQRPEIDFERIMERTRKIYLEDRKEMKRNLDETPNITFFNDVGRFVSDYTMEVSGERIKADKIFLFSGSRPIVSPIQGVEDIDYFTNRNIFDINEKPDSLIILGGGYIATEFAHFFAAVGTDVTLLARSRLLSDHDPEISDLLEKKLSSRVDIRTNCKVLRVGEDEDENKFAVARDGESGEEKKITGESILVAIGRKSNADLLKVGNTGVELDEKGWIKVNEYLETTKAGIWAGGDAIGKYMFKHAANYEASIAEHNAFSDHKASVDYHAIPSAVFTRPQVASVGLTVEEVKKDHDVLVARSNYKDTAKGYAMGEKDGFCKIIIDRKDGKILGAHIIGPFAPILIQEIVNLMYAGDGTIKPLYNSIHIHPALSEVVSWALGNLEEP